FYRPIGGGIDHTRYRQAVVLLKFPNSGFGSWSELTVHYHLITEIVQQLLPVRDAGTRVALFQDNGNRLRPVIEHPRIDKSFDHRLLPNTGHHRAPVAVVAYCSVAFPR